ncbi:protein terminal ear1-like [Bidens hawaiensis]|uniref:protein terminal ear1-like n=1 Tax=Bidens hawaiensis TaxID=980011 RepID=UPI004049C491
MGRKELLIQTLDNHCKVVDDKFINDTESDQFISAYDYLYLPIDFKNGKNAGFAFVNFTNPEAALMFKEAFDGKPWVMFGSPKKLAEISKAKIQGKNAIMNYCKSMVFTGRLDEEMPVLFEPARDGTGRVESKMITLGKPVKHFYKRLALGNQDPIQHELPGVDMHDARRSVEASKNLHMPFNIFLLDGKA